MAPQTATRMSYEEFMALPEEEGKHYELIDGELILNPAPVMKHQRIARRLLSALDIYFAEQRGGEVFIAPVDLVLSPDNILQPDLLVIKDDRAAIITPKNVQGPPHIVVEIISEGTRRKDVVVKRRLYEKYGVDEYWLVDPEIDAIQIYRRRGERFERTEELSVETAAATLTSPLLPGFALSLHKIFAE